MLGPEVLQELPEARSDMFGGAMLTWAVVGELSQGEGPTLQAWVPSLPAGWVVEPSPTHTGTQHPKSHFMPHRSEGQGTFKTVLL